MVSVARSIGVSRYTCFYLYFLSNSLTGLTTHRIITFDGSNAMELCTVVLIQVLVDIAAFVVGQIAQNHQFLKRE